MLGSSPWINTVLHFDLFSLERWIKRCLPNNHFIIPRSAVQNYWKWFPYRTVEHSEKEGLQGVYSGGKIVFQLASLNHPPTYSSWEPPLWRERTGKSSVFYNYRWYANNIDYKSSCIIICHRWCTIFDKYSLKLALVRELSIRLHNSKYQTLIIQLYSWFLGMEKK